MIALVVLAALGNVWLLGSMSEATTVVAASRTIERGAVIERDALVTVQVGTDPALRTVPAGELEALVGQRAAVDIAAGTLVTAESTTSENAPGDGFSLVGIAVTPAMLPGPALRSGDQVRVVLTPGPQGDLDVGEGASGPASITAVVLSVADGTGLSGQPAQSIVTVEVPEADATAVAAMAATGRVALVLDSRDR